MFCGQNPITYRTSTWQRTVSHRCWFLYCPLNAPCGLSKTHSLPCHFPGEKHSEFRVVRGTKTVSPAQSPMSATISSQTGLRLLVITGLQATFLYLMLLQTSAYGSFFQELFESSELKPDSSSEVRRPSVPTALTSWQHLGEQTFLPCPRAGPEPPWRRGALVSCSAQYFALRDFKPQYAFW